MNKQISLCGISKNYVTYSYPLFAKLHERVVCCVVYTCIQLDWRLN